MDLHYSAPTPDWGKVRHSERNSWQHAAAATNGIVTPGNIISVVSVLVVLVGLGALSRGHLWFGLSAVAVGRLGDILDGIAANYTGTKSSLGEAVDAVCDKIGAFAAFIVLAGANIIWWPVLVLLAAHNLINSIVGLLAKQKHTTIHPRQTGKISAVGQWVALLGLVLAAALHLPKNSGVSIASYCVLVVALALGGYATMQYIRTYLGLKSAAPSNGVTSQDKN